MSIRHEYEKKGVKEFYKTQGLYYKNPHKKKLQNGFKVFMNKIEKEVFAHVLDYGCGSGEISEILMNKNVSVEGADPYTIENYKKNTNLIGYNFSFDDVDKLNNYSCVIFSYCLHLLELSKLPNFLYKLSLKSEYMIIISPHKKPEINSPFWRLYYDFNFERVKYRIYKRESV